MSFPNRETIERIRAEYPAGTMIELLEMKDPQAPPVGTIGEVMGVDDAGDLLMRWQNGSTLKVILSVDRIRKVMDQTVKAQILAVRDTGRTNMFDVNMVQRIAYEMGLYDLVVWLEDHKSEYVRFIMYGD